MTNLLFESPYVGLGGNVHTSSIARWKARGRLPIRDNWTFFASSYGGDVISKYSSKSALFRGGGSLWAPILGGRGRRPRPLLVSENYSVFATSQRRPYDPILMRLDTIPACDRRTDGQTDRRNCCRYYSALHCMQCGRTVKIDAQPAGSGASLQWRWYVVLITTLP